MLISFFSISEQRSDVADLYIRQYMANARRGYLQLNYDEAGCGQGVERVGSKHPSSNTARYNAWTLFRRVYAVQPSAVLLPPPPCNVHPHHRIVWGVPGLAL